MAELGPGSPNTAAHHQLLPSTSVDLASRELRAWRERSLRVESPELPWPDRQAAKLVDAMVDSALGGESDDVDASARAWAHTNPSLGVLARRLGALRAGFGAHVPHGDPRARTRLKAVVDAVAVACTAEWLTALGLAPVLPVVASVADPIPRRRDVVAMLRRNRHMREAGVALLAGAAAGAAVIALAASPHASRAPVQAHGRPHHPAPALVQPPAGGRRPPEHLALAHPPSTGGPASGHAVRGGAATFQSGVGTSTAGTPPPSSQGAAPPAPMPGSFPGGITVPASPSLPPVPMVPAVSSASRALARAGGEPVSRM